MRDDLFIRGDVPMTKSEVRAVSSRSWSFRKNPCSLTSGPGPARWRWRPLLWRGAAMYMPLRKRPGPRSLF